MMPKTFVLKSIDINAPKSKVKNIVGNLNNWQAWSPWLICEPEAKVNVADDGKFYTWEGSRVGAGEMQITNESDHTIQYDLTFLKPWKSKAKVEFKFDETGDTTKTEWTMASTLPFFMFWMKTKMEAWIGMDYDRGLKMLKSYTENGHIDSKMEFINFKSFSGCDFIGVKTNTTIDKIDEAMKRDFEALTTYINTNDLEVNGHSFSQYHKFDFVSKKVFYTAGFPMKELPTKIDNKFIKGHLPAANFNTIRHHGSYDYLGNAWSTNMMMLRNKEFKAVKKYHPLEFYLNDPSTTEPKDLITDVCFAKR